MKLISAMCLNRGIGIKNKLPWNLPEDLSFFKKKTFTKYVLMGNNTFESIGKPLPNRVNFVLSKKDLSNRNTENLFYFNKIEDVYNLDKNIKDNLFIIGGEQIYKLFIKSKEVDTIYLTRILEDYKCDTFFPEIPENYYLIKSSGILISKSGLKYSFLKYRKVEEKIEI